MSLVCFDLIILLGQVINGMQIMIGEVTFIMTLKQMNDLPNCQKSICINKSFLNAMIVL